VRLDDAARLSLPLPIGLCLIQHVLEANTDLEDEPRSGGADQMSDVYRIVTWTQLGCPTEPANIEYDGMTLSVKQAHIDAAKGEPSATFAISAFVTVAGDVSHRLNGRVD